MESSASWIWVLSVVGFIILGGLGLLGMIKMFYVKVPQGTALIINDMSSTPKVRFTGGMVLPVIHLKEFMRISVIALEVDRRGKDGLICRDNMRADITVAFYLRVNETQEDVLKVAKAVGVSRASDRGAVNEIFGAKFSEALKTVGKQFDFVHLFEDRQEFRDRIIEVIGNDLNGYALEDVAIDYLEQTPKGSLDATNILDSEGIRKITELTARQNVVTNELERDKELAILKKNVEAREAALALERQQADAEARQKREIDSIRARETAETIRVQEEERQKAEHARIQAQQEIDVRTEAHQRSVEVAHQNRQRDVVIEIERVTRAKEMEVVARERDVELERIEKEKALEEQRKNIANVIRERVAVEKTVAQEEERIKEVRQVSEADRLKQVTILTAEAAAQESLVREVKKAEADEARSRHKAVEINTLAQAELEAAAKKAEAQKRLAEGTQAERSAPGLADARVREVSAAALEKEGLARAKVQAELLIAEAKGSEEKGMADARVREVAAAVLEKEGLAKAKVQAELLIAEAKGSEEKGMADARVIEAQALAKEKEGLTEAHVLAEKLFAQAKGDRELGIVAAQVLLEKFNAESEGLTKKFGAMDNLSDQTRAHEEFRIQIEKDLEQALAGIAANQVIAKEQAEVLATALANAKIDLVGGGGDFFNSFVKSLSVGKAVEGMAGKSPIVSELLTRLLDSKFLTGSSDAGRLPGTE